MFSSCGYHREIYFSFTPLIFPLTKAKIKPTKVKIPVAHKKYLTPELTSPGGETTALPSVNPFF